MELNLENYIILNLNEDERSDLFGIVNGMDFENGVNQEIADFDSSSLDEEKRICHSVRKLNNSVKATMRPSTDLIKEAKYLLHENHAGNFALNKNLVGFLQEDLSVRIQACRNDRLFGLADVRESTLRKLNQAVAMKEITTKEELCELLNKKTLNEAEILQINRYYICNPTNSWFGSTGASTEFYYEYILNYREQNREVYKLCSDFSIE